MANQGTFEGKQLLSQNGWNAFHGEVKSSELFGSGKFQIPFTQGGVALFSKVESKTKYNFNGRDGFFGWQGWGGSVLQWHPTHHIGFGYNTFLHHQLDIANIRGSVLQGIVQSIVDGTYQPQ